MALFSNSELLMIAVILDEEEHEEKQTYKKNKRLRVHQAWKKKATEGEFCRMGYISKIKFNKFFPLSLSLTPLAICENTNICM